MIYLTSDLHFMHKKIIEYEPITRPFDSVDQMNEVLIKNWNDTINKEDKVYVLGDFCMGPADSVRDIVSRLNGEITLVRGNHDSRAKLQIYEEMGIEVKDIAYITYKGRFFILCHFPIASPEFCEMVRRDNSEVLVLYGHTHSNSPKGYVDGTYHIGVDTNDLKPISIEQIWQESWPEEIMTPDIVEYKESHSNDPIEF